MFALLVSLHKGKDLFTELTGGAVIVSASSAETESLSATPTPELIAKEQRKAKQGFCETYLWNCTDLCKYPRFHLVFSSVFRSSFVFCLSSRMWKIDFVFATDGPGN
jgi:hypothetical protein